MGAIKILKFDAKYTNILRLDALTIYVFLMIEFYDNQLLLWKNINLDSTAIKKRLIILEDLKLIDIIRIGRINKLSYTNKGLVVLNKFKEIMVKLAEV